MAVTFPVVVSYSISTSNHNMSNCCCSSVAVVSYSISTSNHNISILEIFIYLLYLIPFLHQTTTHYGTLKTGTWLYLIPFLHQTTTGYREQSCKDSCILFHFYIKPQQHHSQWENGDSCILFHFYIKPQQRLYQLRIARVVSYSISTSNHNN